MKETWSRWSDSDEMPALLRDPWVAMVARFRAIDGVLPPRLLQGPRELTLCELVGEEAAEAMYDPDGLSAAMKRLLRSPDHARASAMTTRRARYFYRPISQHWSFKKMAW